MESGPDREEAEHDRTVVPAMTWLAPLTAPTSAERDRIRERILAGLPEAPAAGADTTKVTVGAAVTTELVRRPRSVAPGRTARARRGPRGPKGRADQSGRPDREPVRPMSGARARFAIAAVAVLALIGSLTGMSLLLARDALPGDALYGVKRTAEAASLGLTFGDEQQALKHLEFASARVSEIETLARRYPDRDSAPVGGYLTALTDFDNDAAAGSRQLIALATRTDGRQLDALRSWARQQDSRLTQVRAGLPAAARNRETATRTLLDEIAARAGTLFARMDCYQITSGSFDDIGALPATGACDEPAGTAPDTPSTGAPGDPDSSVQPTVPPQGTQPPTSGEPTPALPPLPPVGRTVPQTPPPDSQPSEPGTEQPPADDPTIVLPLPLPTVELPPLLPGLPGVRIGQ